MAMRCQRVADFGPRRAAVRRAELPHAIVREAGIDGAHAVDIVSERPEAGAVIAVPGNHRGIGVGTVIEAVAMTQFVCRDTLHFDFARASVARDEIPRRAVTIAAMEHDDELVVPAEGRSQTRLCRAVKAIHRDDQFAGVGIGLRRITVKLKSQIDAGDRLPARIGIDDGLGEGTLPSGVYALGHERIPVDPDPGSRACRVPLCVCHVRSSRDAGRQRAKGMAR